MRKIMDENEICSFPESHTECIRQNLMVNTIFVVDESRTKIVSSLKFKPPYQTIDQIIDTLGIELKFKLKSWS